MTDPAPEPDPVNGTDPEPEPEGNFGYGPYSEIKQASDIVIRGWPHLTGGPNGW